VGDPSFLPGRTAKMFPLELKLADLFLVWKKKIDLPIASIDTLQPRDCVVLTNQSRTCLSESVSVRRFMPISVVLLESGEHTPDQKEQTIVASNVRPGNLCYE